VCGCVSVYTPHVALDVCCDLLAYVWVCVYVCVCVCVFTCVCERVYVCMVFVDVCHVYVCM